MKNFRSWAVTFASLAFILILGAPAFAATVKALVDNTPITDTQIAERARLMALEHKGTSNSDRLKLALNELVDEALKLEEAKRIGLTVTQAQVDQAYINIARNLKVSGDKLTQLLLGSGVNPQTLKDRLKAGIAWQGVVQRVVSPTVNVSDLSLEEQARKELSSYDNYDYILKEVLFVIPKGAKVSTSRRTAQANQYRKSFSGCDGAVKLSLSYTDVAVVDLGRRHATQLPDPIAKELAQLNVGQLTKPRVGNGGVSMLAVCAKDAAEDTSFVKSKLRQEEGNDKVQTAADAYLKSLRAKAAITYK